MYLASMGKLKHPRTRNTIAAEPTPRSSRPSSADSTTAPAAAAGATDPMMSQGATKTARVVRSAPAKANTSEVKLAEPVDFKYGEKRHAKDVGDSSPRSHPHPLLSTAYRHKADSDHDDRRGNANVDNLSTLETPAARRSRVRVVASSNRRKLGSGRPRSAGPVGRRPRSPSAGRVRHAMPDGGAATERSAAEEIPLHVGPEIIAQSIDVAAACGARGERPAAARRRPASAGGVALAEKGWRAAQQSPARVVHRRFGCGGGARSGGGRGGGRGGRDVRHKGGGVVRPTSKAAGVPGGESTARTAEGSFVESVIKSARPFADYDYSGSGTTTTTKAQPKSPGAAATAATAAPAFDPEPLEAHSLAAETRLMPVGAIGKAFKGRRLAAVQAWDPQAAAAVRAARAEKLLRRTRVGRAGTTGAPMPAAASARRLPRATKATVESISGNEALRRAEESEGRRRAGPPSARRRRGQTHGNPTGQGGKERGGGESVDWCGNRALKKDCRRWEFIAFMFCCCPSFELYLHAISP